MDPALIIFAIEAAIRLGQKLRQVLVDETRERALVLPLGDLAGDVSETQAIAFFAKPENQHLILDGGPYFGFDDADLAKAYATLRELDDRFDGAGDTLERGVEAADKIFRFEQLKKEFAANPPLQRVLGAIVEIGVDYFAANPAALGKQSAGRKVLVAFVARLDDVEFAEGSRSQVVGEVLSAALRVFDENLALVDDDARLQALLGGVTKAVIEEIDGGATLAKKIRREDFFKRVGRSILRGGATAFSENTDLFLPEDSEARPLVESALRQTLVGLRDHERLFTSESVEVIFGSALRAVGENPALLSDDQILQDVIAGTTSVLASREVEKILSRETASAILVVGLEATAENVETLIVPDSPRKQLASTTVAALAQGLSNELAGGAAFRDLLSRRQRVALASIVFDEVAKHPEHLLGDEPDDPKRTALAQVIGSVAAALGDEPQRLVNGEGVLELVGLALHVSVDNADKLLSLGDADPETNLLFRVLSELATATLEADDPRRLASRSVFLELAARALPVVSANVGPLLADDEPVVQQAVAAAFALATGVLENRINGENLPILVEQLLLAVLRDGLVLDPPDDVLAVATEILDAA